MNIIQVGSNWIGFLPGKLRVPGEFKLRSQAVKAYQDYLKVPRVYEAVVLADDVENIKPVETKLSSLAKLEQAQTNLDIFSAVPKQAVKHVEKPKGKPGRPRKLKVKTKSK